MQQSERKYWKNIRVFEKIQKNADKSEVRDVPIECADCLRFIASNEKV